MSVNGQPPRPAAREQALRTASGPGREPVHLATPLRDAVRSAEWLQTRTPPAAPMPPGTDPLGIWSSPDGAARLAVGEPNPDLCPDPDQRCAAVVLTGDDATHGTWTIKGHCPVAVLPDLLTAASLPPGATDPDPPSLLPPGIYFREFSTGYPRGQCYQERWIDWGWGADYLPLLSELIFFLPGSTSVPDAPGGWHLVTAGPNDTTLHADLKAPRRIVAALVAAVVRRSYEN